MNTKITAAILAFAFSCGFAAPALAQDNGRGNTRGIIQIESCTTVSAGSDYSMAIKTDGSLWTWGFNNVGQLGDGAVTVLQDPRYSFGVTTDVVFENHNKAVPDKILNNVAYVYAGEDHAMAIKTDGSLWGWGRNDYGQLGDGTTEDKSVPTKIMDDVAAVTASNWFTAAIKTDGSLWTWGENWGGQIGNGAVLEYDGQNEVSPAPFVTSPVKVMDDVASVSSGGGTTVAVKTDGSLWGWGNMAFAQVRGNSGRDTLPDYTSSPIKIMDDVASAYTNWDYIMVIKTDGSLWGWGSFNDTPGQPQNGSNVPIKITDGVASVVGGMQPMFIKTDDSLWGCVPDENSQQGNGANENNQDGSAPALIKIMDDVAAASASWDHTLAIKKDGSLWAWGRNDYGQLGNGSYESFEEQKSPIKIIDRVMLPDETAAASRLYTLGLYKGVGNRVDGRPVFALDSVATRYDAITMLVRLLGKEKEARDGDWSINGGWVAPYFGYAYANGLTNGANVNTFGGDDPVSASDYIGFILLALGYSEKSGDFAWGEAWKLSDELGITAGDYSDLSRSFTRKDAAAIALNALPATCKGTDKTLIDVLIESGAVTKEAAASVGLGG